MKAGWLFVLLCLRGRPAGGSIAANLAPEGFELPQLPQLTGQRSARTVENLLVTFQYLAETIAPILNGI